MPIPAPSQTATPVFIHSFWRGGGTYLWSKFRRDAGCRTFYEPFHEALGTGSTALIFGKTAASWASKHPSLAAPYMAEYAPLLQRGALSDFEKSFSTASFFLEPGAALPAAQQRYVAALLSEARAEGKRPVLSFSRSLGRASALKRRFDALHIVVLRNPAHQWMSCFTQGRSHGNDYFLVMHLMVAGQNQRHPLLRAAAARYGIPTIERRSFEEEESAYRELFKHLPLEASYRLFLAAFLAAYLEALPASDLVVDMDLLGHSSYREGVEARIAAASGIALSLDDAAMPAYALRGVGIDFARCHAEALEEALRYAAQPASKAGPGAEWALFALRAKLEEGTRSYLEEGQGPADGRLDAAAGSAARLNKAELRIKSAEARLDTLRQSTSWRMTAPLRELANAIRSAQGWHWTSSLLHPTLKRTLPTARR